MAIQEVVVLRACSGAKVTPFEPFFTVEPQGDFPGTRVDPFAHSWPLVENWLRAEPDVTAKALMQRLREQLPDVYPTGAQLRTLQRRVQLWRAEQVRRLIFEATEPGADSRKNAAQACSTTPLPLIPAEPPLSKHL